MINRIFFIRKASWGCARLARLLAVVAGCMHIFIEFIGESLRRMPEAEVSDLNQPKGVIFAIC